ncbi:MAG: antirestriction protein ArdA [Chloroflexota bacterium]
MIKLHAQPYDTSARGFYFDDAEEYTRKAAIAQNAYGDPVEEFEIQFIDSDDDLDASFAEAFGLNQANIARFFNLADTWDDQDKQRFIIAVGECGYSFDSDTVNPDDFEVDIYEVDSLKDLAEMFVDEGLYGEIPEPLRFYIDYEAIARDLSVDFSEITLGGTRYAYACR